MLHTRCLLHRVVKLQRGMGLKARSRSLEQEVLLPPLSCLSQSEREKVYYACTYRRILIDGWALTALDRAHMTEANRSRVPSSPADGLPFSGSNVFLVDSGVPRLSTARTRLYAKGDFSHDPKSHTFAGSLPE